MSKAYNRVKRYYDLGLWTKEMVYRVVWTLITPEEYELITGEPYAPEEE